MIKLTESIISISRKDVTSGLVKRMEEKCAGSFPVFVILLSHATEKGDQISSQLSLKKITEESGFSIVKAWKCVQWLVRCGAVVKSGRWGKDTPLIYSFNKDLFID